MPERRCDHCGGRMPFANAVTRDEVCLIVGDRCRRETEGAPLIARPTGGAGWRVQEPDGTACHVTRIVQAGLCGLYCECGGVWEERSPEPVFCRHMRAVEDAVHEYWRGVLEEQESRRA